MDNKLVWIINKYGQNLNACFSKKINVSDKRTERKLADQIFTAIYFCNTKDIISFKTNRTNQTHQLTSTVISVSS